MVTGHRFGEVWLPVGIESREELGSPAVQCGETGCEENPRLEQIPAAVHQNEDVMEFNLVL
ncbi:MAG: hypothetical protein B6D65_01800 [candidate division Zixibacteria bacterium 4484_93]|nr:MAG: hypothetical protein B6D65_01800 [candidate division Zixibacteria bacterium 4484_93]